MARIFSIQFSHDGTPQHAMVSMRDTPFFTEFAVSMLDDAIAAQLPNNKIISTEKGHFAFSDSTDENSPVLMNEIIQAIAAYVHAVKA